jgi:hypothetical protein
MSDFGLWFEKMKLNAGVLGIEPTVAQVIADYWKWGVPEAEETADFLETFAAWVNGELKKDGSGPKRLGDARARAIASINTYLWKRGGRKPAFWGVAPEFFAVELAVRVRRPRTIDQGQTGMCGPAALLYAYAQTEPENFAMFALDLFFKGSGMFKNMPVQPSEAIKQGYEQRKQFITYPVDYVLMCSLRQCTFDSSQLLQKRNETTLPGQIGAWLQSAGYDQIQAETFFNMGWVKSGLVHAFASQIGQPVHHGHTDQAHSYDDALANLGRAAAALSAGKFVLLFGDGELAEYAKGDIGHLKRRDEWAGLGDHHWVAVRKLAVTHHDVTLRVFTWQNTFDKTIALADFIPRYNGYIAARP